MLHCIEGGGPYTARSTDSTYDKCINIKGLRKMVNLTSGSSFVRG
jgi:hypothetical protein